MLMYGGRGDEATRRDRPTEQATDRIARTGERTRVARSFLLPPPPPPAHGRRNRLASLGFVRFCSPLWSVANFSGERAVIPNRACVVSNNDMVCACCPILSIFTGCRAYDII